LPAPVSVLKIQRNFLSVGAHSLPPAAAVAATAHKYYRWVSVVLILIAAKPF
jgi:hypothetical protein